MTPLALQPTYVVVGEVTDIGEVGREYATVTHMIGSRAVQ
jgi:hypothetical protein